MNENVEYVENCFTFCNLFSLWSQYIAGEKYVLNSNQRKSNINDDDN